MNHIWTSWPLLCWDRWENASVWNPFKLQYRSVQPTIINTGVNALVHSLWRTYCLWRKNRYKCYLQKWSYTYCPSAQVKIACCNKQKSLANPSIKMQCLKQCPPYKKKKKPIVTCMVALWLFVGASVWHVMSLRIVSHMKIVCGSELY